ncbi:MAG TPA: glycosyltransferase, partial [Flavobacteriales bacterium]|nr:glycosyltransferase [Flavobacteriales bacterium]
MKHKISIVTPVFNDWDCLQFLISDIGKALDNSLYTIHVLAVNDCSSEIPPDAFVIPKNIIFERLDLVTNVGHQRAILIGLCHLHEKQIDSQHIVVMDSDGEDRPKYINQLLETSKSSGHNKVVFANRTKRSETWVFKTFYVFYKILFRLLTGVRISFGNFSCIPISILSRICNEPDFWNHYSSAMIKSRIYYEVVSTERGERYTGDSKMNINSLILHGLSSLSVYIESIIIRILKINFIILFILILCATFVVYIKYSTTLAIPGWASYTFGIIFNILFTI